ncbi:hypothetical protein BH11MYX1_BH11MYX1_26980 [soil metagenome]
MNGGDVALAGLLFSADEWVAFEPTYRAELVAAASTQSDPWVMAPVTGMLSGPRGAPPYEADR